MTQSHRPRQTPHHLVQSYPIGTQVYLTATPKLAGTVVGHNFTTLIVEFVIDLPMNVAPHLLTRLND